MSEASLQAAISDPLGVPPTLAPIVASVMRMLDQIGRDSAVAHSRLSDAAAPFSELSATDSESCIAILGGRGSGKTTALQFVCAQLLRNNLDIVLPIIRPERFSRRDTLVGSILAALHQTLTSRSPLTGNEAKASQGSVDELIRELERLRWDEALIQRGYGEALVEQQLTGPEFARNAAQLNSLGATFSHMWRSFVRNLLAREFPDASSNRPPLLVVPIDDADLRSDLLPGLLVELRRILEPSQVSVLFCASEDGIKQALISHYLQGDRFEPGAKVLIEQGFLSRIDIMNSVLNNIDKAFPQQFRVNIPTLSVSERIGFSPLLETRSLSQKIDALHTPKVFGIQSILDLFVYNRRFPEENRPSDLEPTPFAECLSPVPRYLVQLVKSLRYAPLPEDHIPSGGLGSSVRVIVEQGLKSANHLFSSKTPPVIQWTVDGMQTGVRFNFTQLAFGITSRKVSSARRVTRGDDLIGNEVAKFVDYYSTVTSIEADSSGNDEKSGPTSITLPSQFTYALLLAYDLAGDDSPLRYVSSNGRPPDPGGINTPSLLSIKVNNEDTDNHFWLIPDWNAVYDSFLYFHFWNRCADHCVAAYRTYPDHDRVVEWLLLCHLQLICAIQDRRAVERELLGFLDSGLSSALANGNGWQQLRRDAMSRIATSFGELYRKGKAPKTPRDEEFVSWFNLHLLWAADSLSSSEMLSEFIISVRREVTGAYSGPDEIDAVAADALAGRIRQNITRSWVVYPLNLLRHLDPAKAAGLRHEWLANRQRVTEEFQNEVRRLGQAGVPVEVLARIQAFGFTREILETLSRLGYPAEYIETLRGRFLVSEPETLSIGKSVKETASGLSRRSEE